MGLFNKLKNALFEEEEIELPITPEKEVVKPVEVKEDISYKQLDKVPKKEIEEALEENERDIFKAENTFKFPEFDEEEFKTNYKFENKEQPKKENVTISKEVHEKPKNSDYNFERKLKQTRKEISKKNTDTSKEVKGHFRPSPVISPVYGVLDKNYKKEDIITVKEDVHRKKYDVDEIRKKAFGSIDEIEKTKETPKEEFYDTNTNELEELLNSATHEQIDLHEEEKVVNNKRSARKQVEVEENNYNDVEDALDTTTIDLEVLDQKSVKTEEERKEDTLENDLFDLIDSMYDNREEED